MTIEAAIGITAVLVVLALALAAIMAVVSHVRCVDAAREAARLAARGDTEAARAAIGKVGPSDASLDLRLDGEWVIARVSAPGSPLLPGLMVSAQAIAAQEESASDAAAADALP